MLLAATACRFPEQSKRAALDAATSFVLRSVFDLQSRVPLPDLQKNRGKSPPRTTPKSASTLGDRRYNDQSSDLSEAAVKRDLAATKKYLARLERIDTKGFPEQEALNKALLARNLRNN